MRTALLEACVGETLAAIEAEEAAESARDPAVRSVLARIARDEATHAELGFRFLAWALDRAEPPLRKKLARELRSAALKELARIAPFDANEAHGLAPHGVLSNATRKKTCELAVRGVLLPAARSLEETADAVASERALPEPVTAHA